MPNEYLFVSCDIIAHSTEPDHELQKKNIAAINRIIKAILETAPAQDLVWASGGDGGHLAIPANSDPQLAIQLIIALRTWSDESKVLLRITANNGNAEVIEGADGRAQLVGDGINLAGHLLPLGKSSFVLVTEGFMEYIRQTITEEVYFHYMQVVEIKNFALQKVFFLSIKNVFHSTLENIEERSDRVLVQEALDNNDFLEVIYRARRLLEINSHNPAATSALRTLALKKIRPLAEDTFLSELFLNIQFGPEVILAGNLIERKKDETLCEYNDEGETMFLILKGTVGIFMPKETTLLKFHDAPDFTATPGKLTGEIAFALKRKRTATLRCITDTAIIVFSYEELLKAFNESSVKQLLYENLNQKILEKILENVWNTAAYLGNSGNSVNAVILRDSWFILLPYTEIISLSWQRRKLETDDSLFINAGLCILVSGQVKDIAADYILNGEDYPILFASFPGDFASNVAGYQLLGNVKLIMIHKDGFLRFERPVFDELLDGIRQYVSSFSKTGSLTETSVLQKNKTAPGKHVFLSYTHDNKKEVAMLRNDLVSKGFPVWWDQDILPGQDWKFEIRKALKHSMAIVLCLSKESQERTKSGIYPEALDAIAIYREYAQGKIFIIPVRLSACETPPVEIDGTRTLDRIQSVDLFPASGYATGIIKLVSALEVANSYA